MTPPIQIGHQTESKKIWEMALQWVAANRTLIRDIAAPYRRYMVADSDDIEQEAIIAAFKALIAARKKNKPRQVPRYFRVIFTSNCMRLAYGIKAEETVEEHEFIWPEYEEEDDPDRDRIEEALKVTCSNYREICIWLLEQPWPTSARDIARHFKVSHRHAQRVISTVVEQISREGK